MQEEIKVHVIRYPDRTNLMMRYLCPETGRHIARSTGTKVRRDADRAAAKWEAELREGRYQKKQRIAWEQFRLHYTVNSLDGKKASTATNYTSTLNVYERTMEPRRLAEVTTAKLTEFVTALRANCLSSATIARHIRQMKVAMNWAHRQGLLTKLPDFECIAESKGARGRAISGEEFDRLIAALPRVIGEFATESWRFYLRGLDASGLRLSESLDLRWDDAPGSIVVDYSGKRPMFRIPAEAEKGDTHRLLPMSPEFAHLLEQVPRSERRGRVFRLLNSEGKAYAPSRHVIGPVISEIGEKAGIKVGQRRKLGDDGKPVTVNKYASAHDLRRAFGFRWSRRVMPPVLRELMRHTDISTTMKFYVGVNAQATAEELWRVAGNTLGNSVTGEVAAESDDLT